MTIASTFFATSASSPPLAGAAAAPLSEAGNGANFGQLLGANLAQPGQLLQNGTPAAPLSWTGQQPTMTAMGLVLENASAEAAMAAPANLSPPELVLEPASGSTPAAPVPSPPASELQQAAEHVSAAGDPRHQPDPAKGAADPAHGSPETDIQIEQTTLTPPKPNGDGLAQDGGKAGSGRAASLPATDQLAEGGDRSVRGRGDERARQSGKRSETLPAAIAATVPSAPHHSGNAAIAAPSPVGDGAEGLKSASEFGSADQRTEPENGKMLQTAAQGASEGAQPVLTLASSQPANAEFKDIAAKLQPDLQTVGTSAPAIAGGDGSQATADLPALDAQADSFAAAVPGTGGSDAKSFTLDTELRPVRSSAALPTPEVAARPGQIGRELGVEIARRAVAGGEELMVRLAPEEMGRIEVRMSFDAGGTLRAMVTAESQAALDMLRRDAGDLGRSLADAGVRADAQSFRFDTKGGDGGSGWQRQDQGGARGENDAQQHDVLAGESEDGSYRPLNSTSQIDLLA